MHIETGLVCSVGHCFRYFHRIPKGRFGKLIMNEITKQICTIIYVPCNYPNCWSHLFSVHSSWNPVGWCWKKMEAQIMLLWEPKCLKCLCWNVHVFYASERVEGNVWEMQIEPTDSFRIKLSISKWELTARLNFCIIKGPILSSSYTSISPPSSIPRGVQGAKFCNALYLAM